MVLLFLNGSRLDSDVGSRPASVRISQGGSLPGSRPQSQGSHSSEAELTQYLGIGSKLV